jgi:hypothetical protein
MPPRTAGFGNRDRFELNGKIGLHRRQDKRRPEGRGSESRLPTVARDRIFAAGIFQL